MSRGETDTPEAMEAAVRLVFEVLCGGNRAPENELCGTLHRAFRGHALLRGEPKKSVRRLVRMLGCFGLIRRDEEYAWTIVGARTAEELVEHYRVIVFLDTCLPGIAPYRLRKPSMDSDAVRRLLLGFG
jgi:hypothetical protein